MARNAEKANLMMNKWTTMKENMAKPNDGRPDRRPYLASECKALPEAEKWRREILREISKKITEIQNAGLGEARLRDLNDEINKLFREKGHWERQIKTLGGPDYASIAPKVSEADGQLVPGGRGYRYFGAAKDLPGVRELFVSQTQAQARRTRGELYKHITPDYYGYRDEEDGTMLAEEEEAQGEINAALRADAAAAAAAAPSAGSRKRARAGDSAEAAAEGGVGEGEEDEDLLEQEEVLASSVFRAHVPLPSQRDLEAALLEKKKKLLLAKYGGVATLPSAEGSSGESTAADEQIQSNSKR